MESLIRLNFTFHQNLVVWEIYTVELLCDNLSDNPALVSEANTPIPQHLCLRQLVLACDRPRRRGMKLT